MTSPPPADAAAGSGTSAAAAGERRRGDRRLGERRQNERRRPPRPSRPSSWFDTVIALGEGRGGLFRSASDGPATPPGAALRRVQRSYAAARAAIGVALVIGQAAVSLAGLRPPLLVVVVVVAYAVQAIVHWLLPRAADAADGAWLSRRQWLATIGVDLLAFSTLQALESATSFNFAALLVLPVLMAGVLTPRLVALATAAAVALLLLAIAGFATSEVGDSALPLARAGLAGIGLFAITLLSGELAGRLVREEQAARGSLELARQQAQLNRLVIEEMADGVLVVDPRLRVRAANPAARTLLVAQGLAPPAPFDLRGRLGWEALVGAVERSFADGRWPEAGRDVTLAFERGHTRTVRLRVRFTRGSVLDSGERRAEPLAVLLLEDVRTAQERLRQEKLAAMGRMSAGIAHEIRNPLAAIAQANALLLEDASEPAQQRLARIVADNVERLERIVDDVLEVAPGTAPAPRTIDARAAVAAAIEEWAGTAGLALGPDSRLRLELPEQPLPVCFDPEHLRRVLVNLLDNAQRHASGERGAIFVRLGVRDDGGAALSVFSDGPPIPPEVERHLFEPFFSTRSRGSGLGLYICRELCERYGARIEYRPRAGAERLRNEFVVTMVRVGADAGAEVAPG